MAATAEDRERLLDKFTRFCEVESPSTRERGMADAVIAELRALRLEELDEDGSAPETGSDAGNVFARIPGPEDARTILLCAHMDTVPLAAPVEVVREEGVFRNKNEGILGADNKAAVATILVAARHLVREGSPVNLELLFTTCEEPGLRGAKAFDVGRLRSEFGFVFDHASPIGELIVAAPTYYKVDASFRGAAAHAGIRPEDGRNAIAAAAAAIGAMPMGRLDDETTANVGRIDGGTAANVVAERCDIELETRSLDDDKAGEMVGKLVDLISEAASDAECDVETSVTRQFRAYRLARTSPPVELASAALRNVGIEPVYRTTGGGSDAHALGAAGLQVLNVANGTERNHQPDEQVTEDALQTMLDVTLGIVEAAA
ncbi:MAG TPA: M20/M25/M40 family metallo-hydrolase [Thermoleophilaceae bacterium]